MTLALFFFFFTNSAVLILFRWHWRSFVIGGGSAFWVLAYGLFYWASRLKLDSLSAVVLYLGYLFLIAVFDFLITGIPVLLIFFFLVLISLLIGTIGFLASYWAVRKLYSAIRVD